jgi:hypothetical protein
VLGGCPLPLGKDLGSPLRAAGSCYEPSSLQCGRETARSGISECQSRTDSLRLRNLEYVTGPIDVVGDEHYDLDGYLELDRQFDLAVEGLLVFLSQFPGYSRSPTASRACCRSRKTRMRRILLPSNS